ncbi:GerMN domain-containing protein [Candidatus Poribacteria bacterium]|nr:GerMN domain-containing protein [Candidatus Poribacteria bacterium]
MTKGRSLKIALAVLWAVAVMVLAGFAFKLLKEFSHPPGRRASVQAPVPPPDMKERAVKLYFMDEDAAGLVAEKRSVDLGAGGAVDGAAIISELIKGPESGDHFASIPPGVRLLSAYELGDTLILDFTRELQTNHPGGSAGELATVYSIVNTVTENLRGINKVQILIEGEETETLAGHIDIRRPLSPDTKWMTARFHEKPED